MLSIGKFKLHSRLLLGTAQYPSPQIMHDAITAAKTEMITISIRRQSVQYSHNPFWQLLKKINCHILPNTAGCFSAKEAITTAHMARELFETNLIKLEVIGDQHTLQPDPFELVIAAKKLINDGFEVLPYCTSDIVLGRKLVDAGCNILMPWASPIGSGQGIINPFALELYRQQFSDQTLIIDAGIGRPSDAVKAMELSFDGVLLNTAVAIARDPVKMAAAFACAIEAGRNGYLAGFMQQRPFATASTPTLGKIELN